MKAWLGQAFFVGSIGVVGVIYFFGKGQNGPKIFHIQIRPIAKTLSLVVKNLMYFVNYSVS